MGGPGAVALRAHAPTWNDLVLPVDAVINLRRDDLHAGVGAADLVDPLRRGDEGEEEDLALLHPLPQQHLPASAKEPFTSRRQIDGLQE